MRRGGVVFAEADWAEKVSIVVGCFLDLVGDVWSRLWRIGKAEANRSSQKAKCNVRIDRREI